MQTEKLRQELAVLQPEVNKFKEEKQVLERELSKLKTHVENEAKKAIDVLKSLGK